MCGLFGMASTEAKKSWNVRKDVLTEAIYASALRGAQGTGLACVKMGAEKELPLIYKRALISSDFLQMPMTDRILTNVDEYSMIIGHTRAATVGSVADKNTHPFNFDHITLAHNGHVTNHHSLLPTGTSCPITVDSAAVALSMAVNGEQETLEKLQGAYALTWHNAKDGTLNIARNAGRPLKIAYMHGENTMWWASERLMLVWLLERGKQKIDGKFRDVTENVWFKFKADDLRKVEKVPFSQRLPNTGTASRATAGQTGAGTGAGSGVKGVGGVVNLDEARSRLIPAIDRIISTTIGAIDTLTPSEQAARSKAVQKQSGRPDTQKRITKMEKRLKECGYPVHFGKRVLADVLVFKPYKNQATFGTVTAHVKGYQVKAELHNISSTTFREMIRYPELLGVVIGVKDDPNNNDKMFIIERDIYWPEFGKQRRAMQAGNPHHSRMPVIVEHKLPERTMLELQARQEAEEEEGAGISRPFHGPGGSTISAGRFADLTKNGCATCEGHISKLETSKIIWIEDTPVCQDCATNPQVLSAYNIPIPKNLTC